MPTSRAYSFAAASIIIYLFGNQTQVGWLYVVSALLLGSVVAAWWLSRSSQKGLSGTRQVGKNLDADLYENDEVEINFTLRKTGANSNHLRLTEVCPLAAPDSQQRTTRLFVPALPGGEAVQFTYHVTIDRRGLHTFPAVETESYAPFGFFKRKTDLEIVTRTLVYPEVRPLKRLELLDRQLNASMAQPRAGVGYEVMGVRPYRTGDSPRHIHWRSVARTGQLISKEFADEAQPGLILTLDLFAHPYPATSSKHMPFEWAVKCAASIGAYVRLKGYSLHIMSDDDVMAAPVGPVAGMALLQYLARVEATGKRTLTEVLRQPINQQFIAVVLPWPDKQVVERLVELRRSGIKVLAVMMDATTFPDGGMTSDEAAGTLRAQEITVREVAFGDDWAEQLF